MRSTVGWRRTTGSSRQQMAVARGRNSYRDEAAHVLRSKCVARKRRYYVVVPSVRVIALVAGAFLAILCCSCWSGGGSSTKTETPTSVAATPTVGQRRSGIASVDAVIDAVAHEDANALAQLMRFPKIGCTTIHEGLGGPPYCPDGVSDGTLIE